ncbi:MAG: ABC transporter substrate-binding protein [Nitrospira sp.]|nr:ABC transporter substrate-binding protein [Nitrospira sp.]
MDSSGQLRAEGSWGPYSVFTIYPTAYERIRTTGKIRIGTYNVSQVKLESKDSVRKDFCVEPFEPFDGLSVNETNVLCGVIKSMHSSGMPDLKPVVTRYSDIDHKLLLDLKAGELDLAFGNISKAGYRKGNGIHFVEYAPSKPVLLTNDEKKRTEEIGRGDRICAVQGTVYEHVLGEIIRKTPGRYNFVVCQNTIDAVDRL